MSKTGSGEVDFTVLEAYASGDRTFIREVLTLYRAEAVEWAQSLDSPDDWRSVIHTMKGTSRTIGANVLGDLCERVEADGAARLSEVRASLARVVAEIADYLETLGR